MNHFSFYAADAIMPPENNVAQPEEDHQELEEPAEEQIDAIVEKPTEKPTEAPETKSAEETIKTEKETHAATLSTESTPVEEKTSYADSLMTTLLIVIPVLLVAVVSVVIAVMMKKKKAAAKTAQGNADASNNSEK